MQPAVANGLSAKLARAKESTLNSRLVSSVAVLLASLWSLDASPAYGEEPAKKAAPTHVVTPELQARIDEAIRRGTAYLIRHQRRDLRGKAVRTNGTFPELYTPNLSAPMHSFLLYTLVSCGVDPEDEAITLGMDNDRIFGKFHDSDFKNYGYAAHALFCVAWIEAVERKYKDAKRPPGRTRRRIRACKRQIRDIIDAFEKNRSTHIWRYPGPWPGSTSTEDLSATQYVMLAIKAAVRVGVIKPKQACELCTPAIVYMIEAQEASGSLVRLQYVNTDKSSKRYGAFVTGREVEARGWPYIRLRDANADHQKVISGSMTAAGVACLSIAKELLVHAGRIDPKNPEHRTRKVAEKFTLADVDRAILSGWAKLGEMFTVSKNPGAPSWHYYWLYGVERAGALLGVANMGSHHWYREGATFLLEKQVKDEGADNGRWPGSDKGNHVTERTCFALLFLHRATRKPLVPLLPPVTTD